MSEPNGSKNMSAPLLAPRPGMDGVSGFCIRTLDPTVYYADSSATLKRVLSHLVDSWGVPQATMHPTTSVERPRPDPDTLRPSVPANGAVCVSDNTPGVRWHLVPQWGGAMCMHLDFIFGKTEWGETEWHRSVSRPINVFQRSTAWHRKRAIQGTMENIALTVLNTDVVARQDWEKSRGEQAELRESGSGDMPYDCITAWVRAHLVSAQWVAGFLPDPQILHAVATSQTQAQALSKLSEIYNFNQQLEYVRELDGERVVSPAPPDAPDEMQDMDHWDDSAMFSAVDW